MPAENTTKSRTLFLQKFAVDGQTKRSLTTSEVEQLRTKPQTKLENSASGGETEGDTTQKNSPGEGTRGKKKDEDKPFTKNDLLTFLPLLIEGIKEELGSDIPKFTRRFKRFQQPGSPIRVLEVYADEVVKFIETSDVAAALATWLRSLEDHPDFWRFEKLLTPKTCEEVAKAWLIQFAEDCLIETPRAVRFKSDPGLCFHRLPFDLVERETLDAPTWQEILGRMTNAEAFAMRVASLFDPRTSRRQVVWLHGPAKSGKSVALEALGKLMGDAFTSLDCEFDRFWKAPLVGKRMVVVNESASSFLRNDKFKAITGDDMHLINDKLEKKFTAHMEVIMFFSSNEAPHVPKDEALLSRVIECRVSPVPDDVRRRSDAVKAKLWKEMENFVGWAWHLYKKSTDSIGVIPCDRTGLLEASEDFEGDATDFLHRHFVKASGQYVLASKVDELMRSCWVTLNARQLGEWREIWKREGVVLERIRIEGDRVRVYQNVRLRSDTERIAMDKLQSAML